MSVTGVWFERLNNRSVTLSIKNVKIAHIIIRLTNACKAKSSELSVGKWINMLLLMQPFDRAKVL